MINNNDEEEASFLYDTSGPTTILPDSSTVVDSNNNNNVVANTNVKWNDSGSDADTSTTATTAATIMTTTNDNKNDRLPCTDASMATAQADTESESPPNLLPESSVIDASDATGSNPEAAKATDSNSNLSTNESIDANALKVIDDNTTQELEGKTSSSLSPVVAAPETAADRAVAVVIQPCPYWSEILRSPTGDDRFVPSKDMNKAGSLHGYGLQLAADRSRVLAKSGRKYVSMLLDIATLYDNLEHELLKACSSVDLVVVEVCPLDSIQSFAQQMKWLAVQIRDHIVLELKETFQSHGDTVQAMTQQYYVPARQKCFQMRQKTILARSKYVKAVREAENAWKEYSGEEEEGKEVGAEPEREVEVETEGNGTEVVIDSGMVTIAPATTSTNSLQSDDEDPIVVEEEKDVKVSKKGRPFGKLKRLVGVKSTSTRNFAKYVKGVKQSQEHYEEAVKQENRTIQQLQLVETMILEALQKIEEQRVILFVQSLQKVIQSQKSSLDKMVLSVTKKDGEARAQVQKKGNDFFNILLTGNKSVTNLSSYEAGAGKMEADVLGLPDDVGGLRDEVRAKLSYRKSRIQTAKTLSTLLEDISAATAKFSSALILQLKNDSNLNVNKAVPNETLQETLAKLEGARAYQLWSDLMTILERQGEATAQMARSLKSISSLNLDEFLFTAERDLKNEDEADSGKWKHLCDASRTEARAQERYKQSTMQTAKARERVKTADEEANAAMAGAATPESPRQKKNDRLNKANERVGFAFGKMFSVLPDGGEQAMQMFRPDARRAVAQRNLKEADVKESKDRQALDAAAVATSRALDLYRSGANQVVETYEKEDKAGWEDINNAIQSLVFNVDAFRVALYDSLEKPLSSITMVNAYLLDQVEWTQKTAKNIEMKMTEEQTTTTDSTEMMSTTSTTPTGNGKENKFISFVELEESDALSKMTSIVGNSEKEESSALDPTEISVRTEENHTPPKSPNADSAQVDELIDKEVVPGIPSFARPIQLPSMETKGLRIRLNSTNTHDSILDNTSDNDSMLTTGATVETSVFVSYFMKNDFSGGGDSSPEIIESFSCGFVKGERGGANNLGPVTHGRLFLTSSIAYFVGWMGKKAVLKLTDIMKLEKKEHQYVVTTDSSPKDDGMGETIYIYYAKGSGGNISVNLGCFFFKDEAFQRAEILLEDAKAAAAKALEEAAKAKEETANTNTNKKKGKAGKLAKTESNYSDGIASSSELVDDKEEKSQTNNKELDITPFTPLTPDSKLKEMEVLLEKSIRNISVQQFYDVIWSEDIETNGKSFYQPWLENGNCFNIEIGEWEKGEFIGPWDKEAYPTKRSVTFHIRRKGLVVGPSVVDCVQEHFCRMEENGNRCVLSMSCKFNKLPYCDCFNVQVRFITSRKGPSHSDGVTVESGVHVDFVKNTFLKGKIRSGTIAETKPTYENLFEWAERYCKDARQKRIEAGEEAATDDDDDENDTETNNDQENKVNETARSEVAKRSSVKSGENPIVETLRESANYLLVIVGLILLVFVYRFIFSAPSTTPIISHGSSFSANDLNVLHKRIDDLEAEMKLVRSSLEEILALMKNGKVIIQN